MLPQRILWIVSAACSCLHLQLHLPPFLLRRRLGRKDRWEDRRPTAPEDRCLLLLNRRLLLRAEGHRCRRR
jgi:hypothetical protein